MIGNVFKKEYAVILLFVVVASLMHFFYAPYPSLWLDETIVVNLTHLSNSALLQNIYTYQAHPPLYYFAIKGWRMLWGEDEAALRFFSFIFFLLTVIYIYFFSKKLFGSKAAFFSLSLTVSSFFLIWYSHQARPYALVAFLSVASYFYFQKLLHKFETKTAIWYVVFTVAGLYTHFWFFLLFAGQLAALLIFWKKIEFKKIFLAMFLAGLTFLPWAVIYLRYYKLYGGVDWMEKTSLSLIGQSMRFMAYGQWWVVGIALILGLFFVKKKDLKEESQAVLLSGIYFGVVIFLALAISVFFAIYTPGRREIIVVPAFIALASFLLSKINIKFFLPVLSIVLIFFSVQLIAEGNAGVERLLLNNNDKVTISQAYRQIKSGDVVVLSGLTGSAFDYYFRRLNSATNIKIAKLYTPPELESSAGSLEFVKNLAANDQKRREEFVRLKNAIAKARLDNPEAKIFLFLSSGTYDQQLIEFFDGLGVLSGQVMPEKVYETWLRGVAIYNFK